MVKFVLQFYRNPEFLNDCRNVLARRIRHLHYVLLAPEGLNRRNLHRVAFVAELKI
jgi:hypothetical protein